MRYRLRFNMLFRNLIFKWCHCILIVRNDDLKVIDKLLIIVREKWVDRRNHSLKPDESGTLRICPVFRPRNFVPLTRRAPSSFIGGNRSFLSRSFRRYDGINNRRLFGESLSNYFLHSIYSGESLIDIWNLCIPLDTNKFSCVCFPTFDPSNVKRKCSRISEFRILEL